MFIATHAIRSAKLQRSGMCSRPLGLWGPKSPSHSMPLLATDRSPNLGLVRVLERAIKEAKADMRPSDWE